MDMGIIANLEQLYKKMGVMKMLDMIDSDPNCDYKLLLRCIDIKVCLWVAMCWRRVKPKTIRNCFAKAGIGGVKEKENANSEVEVPEGRVEDLANNEAETEEEVTIEVLPEQIKAEVAAEEEEVEEPADEVPKTILFS